MGHKDQQRAVGAAQIVSGVVSMYYGYGNGRGLLMSGIKNASGDKEGTYNQGTKGWLKDSATYLNVGNDQKQQQTPNVQNEQNEFMTNQIYQQPGAGTVLAPRAGQVGYGTVLQDDMDRKRMEDEQRTRMILRAL